MHFGGGATQNRFSLGKIGHLFDVPQDKIALLRCKVARKIGQITTDFTHLLVKSIAILPILRVILHGIKSILYGTKRFYTGIPSRNAFVDVTRKRIYMKWNPIY